jgi:hypothetical protein
LTSNALKGFYLHDRVGWMGDVVERIKAEGEKLLENANNNVVQSTG